MTSILVCIPTVPGRQPYLTNCVRGYERATRVPFNFSIVFDARSAGEGWQRCVDQGLEWFPETTHIHLSNDDIVVARGWLEPLLEATNCGHVPAMRIEPAGGHIEADIFQTHPPMPPDYLGKVPRNPAAYFFAGLAHEQPTEDWTRIRHANLPFCSVDQWRDIGPFPPIHYGSDCWFAERALEHGYKTVARLDSVAFNYNANIGRHRPEIGWTEQDFLDFDGVFALPAYLKGELLPSEPHPLRCTPEGLKLVRSWRVRHLEAQERQRVA